MILLKPPAALYKETTGLCVECAQESPAHYEERPDGMWLIVNCNRHGRAEEKVENDVDFFKWGYEQDYQKPFDHLVLPVTYRCNLKCKYCYTMSNALPCAPADRPFADLTEIANNFNGNITLIGGEPTLRDDLLDLISVARNKPQRKVSLGTNGQALANPAYVQQLKKAGLNFVFLSFNHIEYEESIAIYENKLKALKNCLDLRLPVWLHQTIDDTRQLDALSYVLDRFAKIIFSVTVRAVKPFGLNYPRSVVFVSDMIKYLKKESDYTQGSTIANRQTKLGGITVKLCSWVNDVGRIDPVDSKYVISDGTITAFHRGMRVDEVLIKADRSGKALV